MIDIVWELAKEDKFYKNKNIICSKVPWHSYFTKYLTPLLNMELKYKRQVAMKYI